jgi:uncharacterized protein (DUF302 family)
MTSTSADNGIIQIPSSFSFDETVRRLEGLLQAQGIKEFCVIDHSGEAEKAGLHMPPTKVIIFGKPQGGTPPMLASPSLAIDLPLKALIAEDSAGKVTISYNSAEYLKQRHSIPDDLVKNIAIIGPLLQKVASNT